MAKFNIRYLTVRFGQPGTLPRYYWQPSSRLIQQGWRVQRVPLDWQTFTDPSDLESAAIVRAQELNRELDAVRTAAPMLAARPPTPSLMRTISELVIHYQSHEDWKDLADKSKRDYRQCLNRIEAWAGDAPVRVVTAERVQKLISGLRSTPAVANAVARVLRLLLEHGRRHGWLVINPAIRPGLVGSPPSGLIWPRAAVPAFVAAADADGRHSIGTAILLNEWFGQREGDLLRMPRWAERDGRIWVRQSKTRAVVSLPVGKVEHLVNRMGQEAARQVDRMRAGAAEPMAIIVNENTGLAYQPDNFRHVFADVRAKAAKANPDGFEIDYLLPGRDPRDKNAFTVKMEELTFMHLRHTAVTRLAEAEIENSLIATITGHSQATVQTIIERYMVRTAKMADLAFDRRLAAEGLVTGVASVVAGTS